MPSPRAPMRVVVALFGVFLLSLLSCGREITAPGSVPVNAFKRTGSLAVDPQYEAAIPRSVLRAALGQVAFEKVRIVLRREDGVIILDKMVDFPAGADELTLSLDVPLPATTGSSGLPLSLSLDYINAAGETVFKGGPQTVTVVPSTGAGSPPAAVEVPVQYTGTGANATSVVINPHSTSGTAGQSRTFTAQAFGASGAPIPGTPIVFASSDPSVVSINATSGVALLVGRGAATISAMLLTGQSDEAAVTVTLPAARLELVSGNGQTAANGATLPQPVVAKVVASDGVGVGGVTVNFAVASGGGTVTQASAVSAADGTVSTSWKLGATVGAQSLTVTSAGLTGSPLTISATATSTTPEKLTVLTQPANATAGGNLGTITVAAQTNAGVTVAAFNGTVTVTLGANPGSGTLGGTLSATAVNGVATFNTLSVDKPGNGYTLLFKSSGLPDVASAAFNVQAGNASKLVFGSMPAADAGIAIAPPITVTAQDAAGNTVTSFTGAVTVSYTGAGATTPLSGTVTRNAVAGVATFNDLVISKKVSGATLTATATGLTDGVSAPFNVAPGAAIALNVINGDNQTAAAGAALAGITVKVRDALGNGVPGIQVSYVVATGGGSVTGSPALSDADGLVSIPWTLGAGAGAQSVTVSATGLPSITINATATGGASNQLVVTTSPNAVQTAGVTLTPSVSVSYKNAAGALQTGFTGPVVASVLSGPAGATLGGTVSVNAVGGIATFSALRLTKKGTYTLQFSTSGATNGSTASFTVNPAPAKTIVADSGMAQTGSAATALAQKLVVLVTDSLGNPVSAAPVTWAVTAGGGSLSGTTTATDANGRARATFTLGATAGANNNTVTATSASLVGSPVTFTASALGVITTTLVSPHLDTLVSFGAARSLAASSKDAANNAIGGSYTWVSRTPSVATVDVSGVVTAVANGSTWIVATETGGTKDSAQIVVQQRVATINVTPGSRSIYKTRTFTFTASAVDGNGNAMTGSTIKWSTVTPSIATVDSLTGVLTAVNLGSTQLQAKIGAVTGVSTVTVLTPITRIIVGRDASGIPVTDTTSLLSLGIGRFMRAEARDTLDAPMTGVTFAWSSTNGSVAFMDSITATRARAFTNANGTTTIQATADNITGSATLKVQQQLASIELTPTPDSVGVGGTKQMIARGKDANARYITGGSFTFASGTPTVATINAATGVLTGVALGSTSITATSGAITSNVAAISVTSTVPGIISFGRDTLTVGRGSNVSIPILLSRPNAQNVVVNLAARDTNAYFSVASVTIPAGQTSANVTLNGRNAGTTVITALDGGSTGFAGDTAAVAVQANMRIATTNWYVNAGDQVASQVLLSDPSPAGGTFVTFNYGTAGKAQVSPDPAFIPAGQLASNIVITSLGTTNGSTTITPVAAGVNGTASTMQVYAPVLTISAGATARLGAGQYENGWYVYTPQSTNNAVPLTFTSTNASIVTVSPASGSIPAGSYYQYFTVNGIAAGTASVIVSAPGWTPDTLVMTITSPRTTISATTSLNTTSPVTTATIFATDSLGNGHYRTSSLALTVSSSDTNVIKIIDKTASISVGQYYTSGVRYQPGGTGGTAYIKVVAGGHAPDSVLITVVGPKLDAAWSTRLIGKGQYDGNQYVQTPNNVVSALSVGITTSDPLKVSAPATVTVPAGSYYTYFNVAGIDTGFVSMLFTAPGYQGDTAYYRVTSPRLNVGGTSTLNNFGPGANFYVQVSDSTGSYHLRSAPLAVSLASTNPAVVTIDSTSVTIGTGSYYSNSAHVSAVGVGSAYIVASAPGHKPDSTLYTVQTPKLSFNFTAALTGLRQAYSPTSFYVATPDYRPSALSVTLSQSNPSADSLTSSTLTIPGSSYYAYFGAAGRATGVDTVIATAPGYLPDTAIIRIGPAKLAQCCMPGTGLTTSPNGSITVYAADSAGGTPSNRYVLDTLVLRVTASDTTVIKPVQRYVRIPRGAYYTNVPFAYYGPGTSTLTITDSAGAAYGSVTTSAVTVTGPSLVFSNTSAIYGMRQTGSGGGDYYVYTQNNVASNTTVTLLSTDTRVATVPSSVTILAGSNIAYFNITAKDTVGTVQVQASAVGFGPPTPINVQVTQPKFVFNISTSTRTTGGPQTVTVYPADANGTVHYATEAVTVTLSSSSSAVATIDSTSVVIPAGSNYNNSAKWIPHLAGTAQLTASDARPVAYSYSNGTVNVSVTTPALSFSWNTTQLGRGQYFDPYVQTPDYQPIATAVTLGHNGVAKTTLPASATIPINSYYQYFRVTGTNVGTDTLTAQLASPFHTAAVAYVQVDSGRVDSFSNWPSASMHVGDSVAVTLYTRDPSGYPRNVAAATSFAVTPGASLEIHQSNAVVTSVTVPADGTQVVFYLKAVATGTSSATFTNANYKTYVPPNVTVIP